MIPKAWIALSLPCLLISIWLITRTAGSLIRKLRDSIVLTVPVSPSQPVTFSEPGAHDLNLEGRRGANLSGLDFQLYDGELRVPLDSLVVRTTVSGLSRVRLKVRSFHLSRAGTYTLDISGLRSGLDPENRVVFTRPAGGVIVTHVLALVALGILAIGSIVGSILPFVRRR
jgi:hypothetical protein